MRSGGRLLRGPAMYREHFGLREPPFSLTPDTAYFLNRAGYQDALNVLLVALRGGEGFVKVVGEVGTGKTLLCRKLINTLGSGFYCAYIHNPYLEPGALLEAVADELRVPDRAAAGQHDLLKRIGRRLVDLHVAGRRVVLCLDEVQAMPRETLEMMRLLTNLETEKRKLIQVVLFGQPELDEVLAGPSVRQLRQRITFSYRLLPMNRPACDAYVAHRLAVAGSDGRNLFTRGALEALYRASQGVPRLVNILCHKALMAAYGKGLERVDRACMRRAIRDTAALEQAPRRGWLRAPLRWLRASLAVLVVLAGGGGMWWLAHLQGMV